MRVPRTLRQRGAVSKTVALCGIALLAASVAPQPADALGSPQAAYVEAPVVTNDDALESPTIWRINAVRRSHGLKAVRPSPALGRAAVFHASSMARFGYFGHTSRDGTTFGARLARYYPAGRFASWAAGETLLWSSPDVTPERAVSLWLASPKHRRILLDPRWREVGLQAVHVDAAPGIFGGLELTMVVADFGVRVSQ